MNVRHVRMGQEPSQEEGGGVRKHKHLSIEGGTLLGKRNGDATNPMPHQANHCKNYSN